MRLIGEIILPGDKSISHRAVMFNAVSYGEAKITHLLKSDDVKATIHILKELGVEIIENEDAVYIKGKGFLGLHEPTGALNCMNSGTSARLFMGLLSGLDLRCELIGDESLSKRPMKRVVKHLIPLRANINLYENNYLPALILPSKLSPHEIFLDVSSAQVKSAVLLAALKIKDKTTLHELNASRNHTELMLKHMGADISVDGLTISISGKQSLKACDMDIPGDISSASFFIVACLITKGSSIVIKNCGLNPTRTGILTILKMINAHYEIKNQKTIFNEIVGDIHIAYQNNLKPFVIEKALVPLLIDEIPILTLLATQIEGTSTIRDAKELRVKESDRIKVTTQELNKLGAHITECDDGMIIEGKTILMPKKVDTHLDHRISMMLKVAKIICCDIYIQHSDCDAVSYPDFENDLMKLLK